MTTHRPCITLHTPARTLPEVQGHLQRLLRERCGPCTVIVVPSGDRHARHVTYTLSGPWTLSAAEVHRHLVAVFGQLGAP